MPDLADRAEQTIECDRCMAIQAAMNHRKPCQLCPVFMAIKGEGEKEEVEAGNEIANATNSHFDGVQPGFGGIPDSMQFTDNVTHSTTYGNSMEEVRGKLNKMRKEFGK